MGTNTNYIHTIYKKNKINITNTTIIRPNNSFVENVFIKSKIPDGKKKNESRYYTPLHRCVNNKIHVVGFRRGGYIRKGMISCFQKNCPSVH